MVQFSEMTWLNLLSFTNFLICFPTVFDFTQKLKVILIANRPELTIFQGFLNRTLGLMSMGTGAKFAAMAKVSKLWKGFVEVLSIINAIVQGRKAGCICDFAIVSVIKANSSSGMASPSQTV